jgi:hypothetical protein
LKLPEDLAHPDTVTLNVTGAMGQDLPAPITEMVAVHPLAAATGPASSVANGGTHMHRTLLAPTHRQYRERLFDIPVPFLGDVHRRLVLPIIKKLQGKP